MSTRWSHLNISSCFGTNYKISYLWNDTFYHSIYMLPIKVFVYRVFYESKWKLYPSVRHLCVVVSCVYRIY